MLPSQRVLLLCLVIFQLLNNPVCVGEKFNFEVARRTHDNVDNFLGATLYPTQQLAEAFELGILNATAPTFFSDARVLFATLLTAVPQIGAMYVVVGDKFMGFVNVDDILLTTENIFGATCPGVAPEGYVCVNFATIDENGNPIELVLTDYFSREELRIAYSNTSDWSPIRRLSRNAIGTDHTRPLFNDDGSQLGMVSAGVMTSNLDTFLFDAFGEEPDNRVVYIVERTTGKLVAASVPGVTTTTRNDEPVQVLSLECSNKLIRESSTFLFGLSELQKEVLYTFNGYYVQFTPYTAVGIDWLIVVVRPADIQDDYVSTDSVTYLVMCVICGLCVIVTVCLIVWVIRFRDMRLWKAGQPAVLLLVLIANLTSIFAALVSLGPMTEDLCLARQWLLPLALTLTCSSLIAKLLRVYIATNTKNLLKKKSPSIFRVLTERHVVGLVLTITVLQVAFLFAWTAVDAYRPHDEYRTQDGVLVSVGICKSDSIAWSLGNTSAGILIIAFGCYLSFMTRNVSELLAESRSLMLIFYHGTFVAAVVAFVAFFAHTSTKSVSLFVAIALLWFTLTTQLALFLPRIYRQITLGDLTSWEMRAKAVQHLNKERQQGDMLFGPSASPAIAVFGNNQPQHKPSSASNQSVAESMFVI